ncbi:unnamed protein product [Paramecium sonneborni]|uniref:Uncharacterized protein n=1 Tax=Paramecium sonneborni TaxID=65129 RepID=A0A8S1RI27_9CILI|nr:unnamed protein product [Paramecium sonneborni]
MKQIPGLKHDGSYLLIIKHDKNKANYVCDECCLEWEEQQIKDELVKLIHIKKAFRSQNKLFKNLICYLTSRSFLPIQINMMTKP